MSNLLGQGPTPPARSPRRGARFRRLVLALGAAAAAAGAAAAGPWETPAGGDEAAERRGADDRIEALAAAGVAGTLTRPRAVPGARAAGPAVVVVHDAPDPDPRASPYAAQLAAAGFHVLDLLSHAADAGAAARAAAALARDPGVDPGRIAALGFGAGGAAVAAAGHAFAARVLLYPGCAALAPAAAAPPVPVLLLHGDADPANLSADCARAAEALRRGGSVVRHVAYRGAGYAWDWPARGEERRVSLPWPGAEGRRVPATSWPDLTDMAAAQVAGFLATALDGHGR